MVGLRCLKKRTAKELAAKRRKQGYEATIYKKKKGWGVSSTRK